MIHEHERSHVMLREIWHIEIKSSVCEKFRDPYIVDPVVRLLCHNEDPVYSKRYRKYKHRENKNRVFSNKINCFLENGRLCEIKCRQNHRERNEKQMEFRKKRGEISVKMKTCSDKNIKDEKKSRKEKSGNFFFHESKSNYLSLRKLMF